MTVPVPAPPALLDSVRAAVLRRDYAMAENLLLGALEHERGAELRRVLAGIYRQTGRHESAESLLREILQSDPDDVVAALGLAHLCCEQGRSRSAASVLRACFDRDPHDPEAAIEASRLLIECDRTKDAAAIIATALTRASGDLRLHVRAAMLAMQSGDFEKAREHYLRVLDDPVQACEWHVPNGMAHAQRYKDVSHPDFTRFAELQRLPDLTVKARASLRFALGKANDDIGNYADSSRFFREANALACSSRQWTRKHWRRAISAISSRERTDPVGSGAATDFTPILIVGMPRSGTTLTAELLSKHPLVCNRGELPTLGLLMQHPLLSGALDTRALQKATEIYARHLRRDDSDPRWFIDKQPFNFRYVDVFLAMFPHARIVYCERSPRDTALSLWTQSFSDEIQGYSCDFADIAAVMQDTGRLVARWRTLYPEAIWCLRYESLVGDPEGTIGRLAGWLGLPELTFPVVASGSTNISTASLWQARQPVHSRSVGRWKQYVAYIPELLKFAVD